MTRPVTGADGTPGRDVADEPPRRGERATGLDRAAPDVTRAGAVDRALAGHRPRPVADRAAYTAVDDAGTDGERATPINGDGPRLLARAPHGARPIHVSSGDARATPSPEDHPTAPRTARGHFGLAGEPAVPEEPPGASAVVRTAWLSGGHGTNFVRKMIGPESRRPTVDVVDDRRGRPPWSADVAERTADPGARAAPRLQRARARPPAGDRPAGATRPARRPARSTARNPQGESPS